MENGECWLVPVVSLTRDGAPGASVLLLFPSPLSTIHFPSPTVLIFVRALPWSFWKKAERKKKSEGAHSLCHLPLPRSQTRFIPHSCGLQSSAVLCSAAVASSTAEHRSSLGSSQICLPVCGKCGILSQSCLLTALLSHSRVIKKERHAAPNPQPSPLSPLVFSRHCSISVSIETSGTNVLADTFTPLGPDWITGKERSWAALAEQGCLSTAWCRHACVIMGAHERLPLCSLFLLMNKSVKCIFTFGPFGRVSTAAKSHNAKNKNIYRNYPRSLHVPTWCEEIPSPFPSRGDPCCCVLTR